MSEGRAQRCETLLIISVVRATPRIRPTFVFPTRKASCGCHMESLNPTWAHLGDTKNLLPR